MDDEELYPGEFADDDREEGWDGDAVSFLKDLPTAEQEYVNEILDNYGIDLNSYVIEVNAVEDPSTIRGERFTSLTDAIDYLNRIGVLSFSNIVYFPEDEEFGADVPDDSDEG